MTIENPRIKFIVNIINKAGVVLIDGSSVERGRYSGTCWITSVILTSFGALLAKEQRTSIDHKRLISPAT